MKVTERRIVYQYWYEPILKFPWEDKKLVSVSGWRFNKNKQRDYVDGTWNIIEISQYDKFGNPVIGIAEKETEI